VQARRQCWAEKNYTKIDEYKKLMYHIKSAEKADIPHRWFKLPAILRLSKRLSIEIDTKSLRGFPVSGGRKRVERLKREFQPHIAELPRRKRRP
jgi:hypothetical protein